MKKRILAMVLGCAMAATVLAGCGGQSTDQKDAGKNTSATEEAADGKVYKVGIVQYVDDASLNQIVKAVKEELDAKGKELGVTFDYDGHTYNGQADATVMNQIASDLINDGVDAIVPVATPVAMVMQAATEETQTPVVYAAISDPDAAELTGIDYVTGTSDALNTDFIMDMMFKQNPDVQKVGLLYSLSEANSTKPITDAKAYLDEKGIAYEEKTASTNDEVITATSALVADGVDAVFTPTDNVIMAAELAIYENLAEAGIPHYTGADSFVRNGAFATCGVNYTDLGHQTADLAYEAVTAGMADMDDYYLMDGGIITVNTETAAALGIDYSVFNDMGEVVEVTTTEE